MKHRNIALFIPHLGCPHNCAFCNQHCITGNAEVPNADDVIRSVEIACRTKADYTQLAFFGGSFTAIDRDYMLSLLQAAKLCKENGMIDSVRISTRPDCINEEILLILKEHCVHAIELGAQSMDDVVLTLCERGHTVDDVIEASKLIKKYGFSLGLQMMTGLPGDTYEKSIVTANKIAELEPDTVRIYPTVTLKGTKLANMYESGEYVPTSLEESVELCSQLLLFFESKGIDVIKLGLQYEKSMEENYVAGAFHPAFRELCENRIYLNKALGFFNDSHNNGINTIEVAPGEVSKMTGQRRSNLSKLSEAGYNVKVSENTLLVPRELIINGIKVE